MRKLIIKCRDCGTVLASSKPLATERDELLATFSAPLNTPSCPKGCAPTYSDCNSNTIDEFVELPAHALKPDGEGAGS